MRGEGGKGEGARERWEGKGEGRGRESGGMEVKMVGMVGSRKGRGRVRGEVPQQVTIFCSTCTICVLQLATWLEITGDY